jgi:hypothetical protein
LGITYRPASFAALIKIFCASYGDRRRASAARQASLASRYSSPSLSGHSLSSTDTASKTLVTDLHFPRGISRVNPKFQSCVIIAFCLRALTTSARRGPIRHCIETGSDRARRLTPYALQKCRPWETNGKSWGHFLSGVSGQNETLARDQARVSPRKLPNFSRRRTQLDRMIVLSRWPAPGVS